MAEVITLDMFTTIVKIEVISGYLVLECKTGVGAPQTGVPPMFLSNIPGAPGSFPVFSSTPITKGKAVLVQPQQLQLTSRTGQVFLLCNLSAMRAQQKSKTITLKLLTPPGQSQQPINTTYYWLVFQGAPAFTPSINPLFPLPGAGFGFNIESIWRDDIGNLGSADIPLAAAASAQISSANVPLYSLTDAGFQIDFNTFPGVKIDPTVTVFNQQAQIQASSPGLTWFIVPATFPTQPPDSTAWVLRAGVWRKKADIKLPPPGGDIPLPLPAVQPTSFASTGGGVPQKTVTVTVSPPPANTITLS